MTLRNEKGAARQPAPDPTPDAQKGGTLSRIHDDGRRRTRRFDEEAILPALRGAFSERPEWRGFSPHQLSVLMFLYGYLSTPPEEFDVEAALPFAYEDREGVA